MIITDSQMKQNVTWKYFKLMISRKLEQCTWNI